MDFISLPVCFGFSFKSDKKNWSNYHKEKTFFKLFLHLSKSKLFFQLELYLFLCIRSMKPPGINSGLSVQTNCSCDLQTFANSRPSVWNFKSFSWLWEQKSYHSRSEQFWKQNTISIFIGTNNFYFLICGEQFPH